MDELCINCSYTRGAPSSPVDTRRRYDMTFSTFAVSPITPSASYTSRCGGGGWTSTSAGGGRSPGIAYTSQNYNSDDSIHNNNNNNNINGVGKSKVSPVSLVGTFGTGGVAGNRGIIAISSGRANARRSCSRRSGDVLRVSAMAPTGGRATPPGRAPGRPQPEDDTNMPAPGETGADIPIMLNNAPHPREVRRWFYDDCADTIVRTVTGENPKTRVKARVEFPELNVESDVYRVGTLLELVREIAMKLASDGKRVRVCVQGSMGTGVFQALPLSLNGVRKILELMDWGDADEFISQDTIGGEVPQDDDSYFIVIAPQNIVGYSVLPYLQDMEKAAGDRPIIMINPKLGDIQSAGNVMSIRGRGERREYVSGWEEIYHFRLLYRKPYFFPIYGALRYAGDKWELYKKFGKMETEEYKLQRTYEAGEPDAGEITRVILNRNTY